MNIGSSPKYLRHVIERHLSDNWYIKTFMLSAIGYAISHEGWNPVFISFLFNYIYLSTEWV